MNPEEREQAQAISDFLNGFPSHIEETEIEETRTPLNVRMCIGTYPIEVAREMRKKFNEEKKKSKKRGKWQRNKDLENSFMVFRGRGCRTRQRGIFASIEDKNYYQQDLPLKIAKKVAIYLVIN